MLYRGRSAILFRRGSRLSLVHRRQPLQKFLKYVDGGQKHPGIMTNLSHRAIVRQERDEEGNKVTVYKGGASAHLWLITQKVTRMTGTTTRTLADEG